jgi:hypothetical protein
MKRRNMSRITLIAPTDATGSVEQSFAEKGQRP